ncbi:golgin subfamily A member 6-like protein 2 [Esox lucius]|uniref:golgin subfamily A member 6-like protein 2 n=1 Tax=Esox lucius TaxID=8010 RepID=UPI0014777A69|nr:golgin subfamily A member 6-like protein 2 [Esox lucius]
MTNLKMQNILRLGKIGKLTVKNTRLLAENEKARDVLEKEKENTAAVRQTLLHKIAEEEFVYLAKVETGTVVNRLSDENEKVDRVRERNRWKYIRKGLETALAKAEQDKNQTLEAWKKERGAWARVTACLQSLWDQRGERWMKEKEEVKEKSTQAAANWMTELREKERLIEALEREKIMLLSQHEDEKRGWEMEKSEMEKERLVLTGEWDRKNSEMEKMKKEKDRWVIEKKDMLERMKDAHIQMYHMQTVLRFREQEQTQKETKKAQEAKEKWTHFKRQVNQFVSHPESQALTDQGRVAQALTDRGRVAQALTDRGRVAQALTDQGRVAQALTDQGRVAQALTDRGRVAQALTDRGRVAQALLWLDWRAWIWALQ